ncbi:hypothetical protein DA718_06115 [Klebsiella huaxiensis]|uniref:FidL-like protein n=1 Tax=Klebsiella huaxiensis TaxID=2153354 RepID=A0ABT6EHX4_9ENTR|nr:FidL-like protein [Klebsiella huaxiensis]MDG1645007.1 FidL-like protein [Klebsiella huaxiensis]QBG06796.1 hypothetical protein DA718_06115 [Klebsiella huaxiensis]
MRKYVLVFAICLPALIALLIFYIRLNSHPSFSCESQYDLTENTNESILRTQGLLSVEYSNDRFLISVEGLLTSDGDKYIISRSVTYTLKKRSGRSSLFHIVDARIIRHSADNTPENIAQQTLFGSQTNDKIIYINRVNDDTILFGNQTFPQYGCQRK